MDGVPQVKEVPYSVHPSKKTKERKYARFLDIFKRLQINVPFVEAMEEMPTYAKFMKDLLTKKRKFKDEIVELEAGCTAII
jgi:glutaredoxin-related protein